MPLKFAMNFAARHLPQTYTAITTARNQQLPVRGIGDRAHLAKMLPQVVFKLGRCHLPHLHALIGAPRGDKLPVRCECYGQGYFIERSRSLYDCYRTHGPGQRWIRVQQRLQFWPVWLYSLGCQGQPRGLIDPPDLKRLADRMTVCLASQVAYLHVIAMLNEPA